MNFPNPYASQPATGQSLGQNDLSGPPLTPPDAHQSASAELMARVVKGARETIDHLAERATPPLGTLEHGLAETGNVLQDKAGQWHKTGDEWAESVRWSVREHPLVAVATALAVGLVIARITRITRITR